MLRQWRLSPRRRGCRKPCFLNQSRCSHRPWRCGGGAGICAWSWELSALGGGFEKAWLTGPSCFPKPNAGPCWDQVESRRYFRWIVQISWTAQIPELDGAYSHPYRSTNLKEKVNPSFPPRQEPRLKQKQERNHVVSIKIRREST